MENQITTIVCPNCGANASNFHNCEYCGSLLVRYAAENKTVDNSTFGKGVHEIIGLKDELKKNLSYQKIKRDDEVVVTSIIDSGGNACQVVETSHCNYGTGADNPFYGKYDCGVTFRVTFETRNADASFAEKERARLNWFKNQDFYFLFTQQNLPVGVYYYLDFGEDIDNAAKLISSIIMSDADKSETFSFETRMVVSKSMSNEDGLIIDKTAEKSRKAIKLVSTVTIIVIIVIILLLISL